MKDQKINDKNLLKAKTGECKLLNCNKKKVKLCRDSLVFNIRPTLNGSINCSNSMPKSFSKVRNVRNVSNSNKKESNANINSDHSFGQTNHQELKNSAIQSSHDKNEFRNSKTKLSSTPPEYRDKIDETIETLEKIKSDDVGKTNAAPEKNLSINSEKTRTTSKLMDKVIATTDLNENVKMTSNYLGKFKNTSKHLDPVRPASTYSDKQKIVLRHLTPSEKNISTSRISGKTPDLNEKVKMTSNYLRKSKNISKHLDPVRPASTYSEKQKIVLKHLPPSEKNILTSRISGKTKIGSAYKNVRGASTYSGKKNIAVSQSRAVDKGDTDHVNTTDRRVDRSPLNVKADTNELTEVADTNEADVINSEMNLTKLEPTTNLTTRDDEEELLFLNQSADYELNTGQSDNINVTLEKLTNTNLPSIFSANFENNENLMSTRQQEETAPVSNAEADHQTSPIKLPQKESFNQNKKTGNESFDTVAQLGPENHIAENFNLNDTSPANNDENIVGNVFEANKINSMDLDVPDEKTKLKKKSLKSEEEVKVQISCNRTLISEASGQRSGTDASEIRMQMRKTVKTNLQKMIVEKLCKCKKSGVKDAKVLSKSSEVLFKSESDESEPDAEKTMRDLFCERTPYENEFDLYREKDHFAQTRLVASDQRKKSKEFKDYGSITSKPDINLISQFFYQLSQFQHYASHHHFHDPSDPHQHDFHSLIPSIGHLINAVVPHYVHHHSYHHTQHHDDSNHFQASAEHHHHHHHHLKFLTDLTHQSPSSVPSAAHHHHQLQENIPVASSQGHVMNLVDELLSLYFSAKSLKEHSTSNDGSMSPVKRIESIDRDLLVEALNKLEHYHSHHYQHHHPHHSPHSQLSSTLANKQSYFHHFHSPYQPNHTCDSKEVKKVKKVEKKCDVKYGCRCQNGHLTPLSRYDLEGKRVGCRVLDKHLKSDFVKPKKDLEQIMKLMSEAPKTSGFNPLESELFVKLLKNKLSITKHDLPFILNKIEESEKENKERYELERLMKVRHVNAGKLSENPTNEDVFKKIMKKKLDLMKRCQPVWAQKQKELKLAKEEKQMKKHLLKKSSGNADEEDGENDETNVEEVLKKKKQEETCQIISRDRKFDRIYALRMKLLHKINSEENLKFFLEHYPKIRALPEKVALVSQADEKDDGNVGKPVSNKQIQRSASTSSILSNKFPTIPKHIPSLKPKISKPTVVRKKPRHFEKLNVRGKQLLGWNGKEKSNYGTESFLGLDTDDGGGGGSSETVLKVTKRFVKVPRSGPTWTPRESILQFW
ncbi:hypothetical protein HELRODRAFT_174728 [Helobdella robusta]|uniref:Uncharacterized protein n=1 Tax=Helobdella robusta TaxID=6412 RepID=T1F8E7_HELRO|nr:hypothetical protein HELRODRAFT_174728 [Helobdella robusta]ESO01744.1 hypothetical protein HELRODRAFT_174728 [Helobdella robusta]